MEHSIARKFDYNLLLLIILFAIISFISLHEAHALGLTNDNYVVTQVIYYCVSFVLFFGMMFVDLSVYKKLSMFIYFACLLMLVGILILPESISPVINGAQGWYRIGPFSLQPAEFMKIGYILMTSYIVDKHRDREKSLRNEFYLVGKMILVLLPIILILVEYPDLGSMLTFLFMFCCILIVSKIRLTTLMLIVSIPTAFLSSLIYMYFYKPDFFFDKIVGVLSDYQSERIYGWLKPYQYLDASYQLRQSMTSIGAGQLDGFHTITDVPYAYSDFIFAVIGSRYGFIGASIVILLFFLLIAKIIVTSLNYNEDFGKYFGAGVVGFISFHVFQNIGMSIGLLPITGIGLPFVSYGGSSLITCMVAVGLIMSLKVHTVKYMF
ncbi:FtsW/RodA/SpoVE family cell cycle protein [Radiobacillus sp. PE A8.2]|uniref:FtsW/RodA/SpoVE family cell cycle protein n=1 Tax=Radiobacillus sp. PE A8.2 TaxID=3380349 RepID=UPI003890A643